MENKNSDDDDDVVLPPVDDPSILLRQDSTSPAISPLAVLQYIVDYCIQQQVCFFYKLNWISRRARGNGEDPKRRDKIVPMWFGWWCMYELDIRFVCVCVCVRLKLPL